MTKASMPEICRKCRKHSATPSKSIRAARPSGVPLFAISGASGTALLEDRLADDGLRGGGPQRTGHGELWLVPGLPPRRRRRRRRSAPARPPPGERRQRVAERPAVGGAAQQRGLAAALRRRVAVGGVAVAQRRPRRQRGRARAWTRAARAGRLRPNPRQLRKRGAHGGRLRPNPRQLHFCPVGYKTTRAPRTADDRNAGARHCRRTAPGPL